MNPRAAWHRFWFEPTGPADLGACRLVFLGLLFALVVTHDFSAWGEVEALFWKPVTLLRVLGLAGQPSAALLMGLQAAWKASLVLGCVGLMTRVSVGASALLGIYLLSVRQSFGVLSHSDISVLFVLAILMLARCGDACSIDAWLARRRSPAAVGPPASGDYTWPIRMVQVVMAVIFFSAGLSKLRRVGVEWAWSDHLLYILIHRNYDIGFAPVTSWGLLVASQPWLARACAVGTLLLELTYPLALVSRRYRALAVPGMLAMLVGFRLLMGPTFYTLMACHVFWVPWGRLAAALRDRRGAGGGHRDPVSNTQR